MASVAAAQPATLFPLEQAEDVPLPLPAVERPETYSLADVEQIALQHNPTLASAGAHIEAARGKWIQAGLFPNPVAGYHGTEIGNLGTPGQQGAFVSQRIITGGKRRLDQAVADQGVRVALVHYEAQEQRVLNDVRIRFYETLAAQRRVELTKRLVEIGNELSASSKKLHAARQIGENDLLQAEIEAESAYILHDNAQNQSLEGWRRLAAAMGIPTMQTVALAGQLEGDRTRHRWDAAIAALLSSSPELDAARIRVDRAELAVWRARRERIPNIDLSVSVRHITPTDSDVANVQAGLPIPIFDANQGNIHRAESELAMAEAGVQRIELDLQDRLAVAFRSYADASQQADRYKTRILPRADRSLALVKNAYTKGQTSYLNLIVSQRTYIQVNLAYIDALQKFRTSAVVIEGQLLRGSLKNPAWR